MSEERFDEVSLDLSSEGENDGESGAKRRASRSRTKSARDFFRRASEKWLNAMAKDDDDDDEGRCWDSPGGPRRGRATRSGGRRNTVGSGAAAAVSNAKAEFASSNDNNKGQEKSDNTTTTTTTSVTPAGSTETVIASPVQASKAMSSLAVPGTAQVGNAAGLQPVARPVAPLRNTETTGIRTPEMRTILSHTAGLRPGHLSAIHQISTMSEHSDATLDSPTTTNAGNNTSLDPYAAQLAEGGRPTRNGRITILTETDRENSTCYFDDVFDVDSLHSSDDTVVHAVSAASVPSFGALVTVSSFDESDSPAEFRTPPRVPSPWRRAGRDYTRPITIDTCCDYEPPAAEPVIPLVQVSIGGLLRSSSARSVSAVAGSREEIAPHDPAPAAGPVAVIEPSAVDSVPEFDHQDSRGQPAIRSELYPPGAYPATSVVGPSVAAKGASGRACGWPFAEGTLTTIFGGKRRPLLPTLTAFAALVLLALMVLLALILIYSTFIASHKYGGAGGRRIAAGAASEEELYS